MLVSKVASDAVVESHLSGLVMLESKDVGTMGEDQGQLTLHGAEVD